jgi:prolyl-tRNA editing enzyme YbaK/EbsC (Cys-tRNA(Pro) deacylase)
MAQDYPEFAWGCSARRRRRVDPVIVDQKLAMHLWLVFEAGTHDTVRVRTEDLLRITEAQTADICQD